MEPTYKAKERRRPAVDATAIEEAGLRYISRFSASAARVRRILMQRVRRGADSPEAAAVATQCVDRLISRWLSSGILNDARYAQAKAASLHRKGASSRKIVARLAENGVDRADVAAAINEHETDGAEASRPGGDLAAAITLARRRRLGPFDRADRDTGPSRERELAVFARAGFTRAVANRVLSAKGLDDIERLTAELDEPDN